MTARPRVTPGRTTAVIAPPANSIAQPRPGTGSNNRSGGRRRVGDLQLRFDIEKSDPTGRLVTGWFYVQKDAAGQVVDYSGQTIDDIGVLREAAHDFMEHRIAKAMHGKDASFGDEPTGDIVDSILIDDDVAKALGMTSQKRGWFGTMRINDATVQKSVRDGNLKQFSIGGKGKLEDIA